MREPPDLTMLGPDGEGQERILIVAVRPRNGMTIRFSLGLQNLEDQARLVKQHAARLATDSHDTELWDALVATLVDLADWAGGGGWSWPEPQP